MYYLSVDVIPYYLDLALSFGLAGRAVIRGCFGCEPFQGNIFLGGGVNWFHTSRPDRGPQSPSLLPPQACYAMASFMFCFNLYKIPFPIPPQPNFCCCLQFRLLLPVIKHFVLLLRSVPPFRFPFQNTRFPFLTWMFVFRNSNILCKLKMFNRITSYFFRDADCYTILIFFP